MTGRVFVCHASDDAAIAQRAVAALEAGGVWCWIAPRDIDPGENYTQAILDALEAAPAVVLVFSAATNDSPHVQRELETAVGAGRRIVPVRVEAVEPSRSLRYFIGTSQWLEASSGQVEEWAPALVRAVRRAAELPVEPVEPVEPAERVGPVEPAAPVVPVERLEPVEIALPGPMAEADSTRDSSALPPSSSRRRAAVVGAGLVGVAAVAVVVTLILTGGGDDPPDRAVDEPGGSTADSPSPSQVPDDEGTGSPSLASATDSGQGPVTCWDDSAAAEAAKCPVPTGRAGMATIFPGLTADCTQVESPVEGKAEVYECEHDGFLVRYTRWEPSFDKEAYYSVENQVASAPWDVQGEPAGLSWLSMDPDPAETQPYQWSAAYDGHPFSVSIEGDTAADRSAGVSSLQVALRSHIGLQ